MTVYPSTLLNSLFAGEWAPQSNPDFSPLARRRRQRPSRPLIGATKSHLFGHGKLVEHTDRDLPSSLSLTLSLSFFQRPGVQPRHRQAEPVCHQDRQGAPAVKGHQPDTK